MSDKPNGLDHAASDSVGDIVGLAEADLPPLSESVEASQGAILLRSQIAQIEINAARQAERATIEALAIDAMHRYVEAMKRGDHKAAIEATRDIMRLEIYLSRPGFV